MKKAIISLSVAFALLLIYAVCISVRYFSFDPLSSHRSDTIRVHSIDTVEVIRETIAYRTREVAVLDTIYIPADTFLSVHQYEYSDSISTILYSGIDPQIDAISYRIPRDTVLITDEYTIVRPERKLSFGLSVGPVLGYGAGIDPDRKVIATPFVGIAICVGLNYKIK